MMPSGAPVHYRRAEESDYPALARIAADNARDNPDVTARGQGFLTGHFDVAKVSAFNADLGILVADAEGEVVGFPCSPTRDFARHAPILRALLDACAKAEFEGRPVAALRAFFYGPVCVALAWQGRGVARGLYRALKHEFASRFDVGLLFIDDDNPHSLAVHERSFGMTRIGSFQFSQRRYAILSFRCQGS